MARVTYVVGRAGTGKTTRLLDLVCRLQRGDPLGRAVYLVVPRQATFEYGRALAAASGGYSRVRVVSFEDLAEEVLVECGGSAWRRVTAAGRQVLIAHLLRTRAEGLSYFGRAGRHVGLAQELDRTLGELHRSGLTPQELLDRMGEQEVGAGSGVGGGVGGDLVAKAKDLTLLADAYSKIVGETRADSQKRLRHASGLVTICKSVRKARFVVDGFYRFTAFERSLLARLAATGMSTHVSFTLDPDHPTVARPDFLPGDEGLFDGQAAEFRKVWFAAREAGVRRQRVRALREPLRFVSPALRLIERDWPQPRPSRSAVTGQDVRLVKAADARGEAEAAARQVWDWSQTLRLRETAVLCRDIETYGPLLEAAMREQGVAYFLDRRRPARFHPLIRATRGMVRCARYGWPAESVADLTKSGLAGLSQDEADLLENFVTENRLRGRSAWEQPWGRGKVDSEDGHGDDEGPELMHEETAAAEGLRRRLADIVGPLDVAIGTGRGRIGGRVEAVWRALDRSGMGETVGRWAAEAESAGEVEAAAEHRQAWAELVGLLEQMHEVSGGEETDADEFVRMLEHGLDLLDLAIAPPTCDAVTLGDLDRTRLSGVKAVIVVGMNAGIFPRSAEEQTVFGDDDRQLLRERSVDVDDDSRRLLEGERFLAYRAFTSASQWLTLTRAVGVVGSANGDVVPSPFWERVEVLLGIKPEVESACSTPRQVVGRLLQWARAGADASVEPEASLWRYVRQDASRAAGGRVAEVVGRAWPSLRAGNATPVLADEVRAVLTRGRERFATSPGALETYAACPFRFFARHVLRLRVRDPEEVTAADEGSFFHNVLERAVRKAVAEELDLAEESGLARLLGELPRFVGQVADRLRSNLVLTPGRRDYLERRVRRLSEGILKNQSRLLGAGEFRLREAEVVFGHDRVGEAAVKVGPYTFEAGGVTVEVHGRIDRLDVSRDGRHAVVIDYKRSQEKLELARVFNGISLQMPVYLLVVRARAGELAAAVGAGDMEPVGAFYVKLVRGLERVRASGPAVAEVESKVRGVVRESKLAVVDAGFSDAGYKSDVIGVALKKDGGISNPDASDALDDDVFDALLKRVHEKLVGIVQRLLGGHIEVRPYRMGRSTPCSHCEFRAVCRFDPRRDRYLQLTVTNQKQVLQAIGSES